MRHLALTELLRQSIGERLKAGTLDPLHAPPVHWNAGAIYRLHEAVDVYAPALQRWMNERFGDAITYPR
jgi:cyanate lyase